MNVINNLNIYKITPIVREILTLVMYFTLYTPHAVIRRLAFL